MTSILHYYFNPSNPPTNRTVAFEANSKFYRHTFSSSGERNAFSSSSLRYSTIYGTTSKFYRHDGIVTSTVYYHPISERFESFFDESAIT